MTPTGNLTKAKPIAAIPWVVQTIDNDVHAFLTGLPTPDFGTVEETKVLWALNVDDSGPGSAYVVSAETYIYLKAHRY